MRKLEFSLKEKSRANKTFIYLNYEGGDADTDHPEEYNLNIPFDEYGKHLDVIETEVAFYKKQQDLLEELSGESDYYNREEELVEKYGQDQYDALDEVPSDPQCDYQFLTRLDTIKIIGYDKEGNRYESYV